MTREEEIEQEAASFTKRNVERSRDRDYFETGFIAGARWADIHQPSPWISVKDRLPKEEDN